MASNKLFWKLSGDITTARSRIKNWEATILPPDVPFGVREKWCVIVQDQWERPQFDNPGEAIFYIEQKHVQHIDRPKEPEHYQTKMFSDDDVESAVSSNRDMLIKELGVRLGWDSRPRDK